MLRWSSLACLSLGAAAAMAGAFIAPLRTTPITVDGRVEQGEWRDAVRLDGFGFQGKLVRRRVCGYVAATETHIYCAMVSQLPDEGVLVTKVDRDTLQVVFDDSAEVWIDPTPGSEDGSRYQVLFNSAGHVGYKHHGRGKVRDQPAWRGGWRIANGIHDGAWHCELAIPLQRLTPGRRASQGVWAINLCRNWKQPWQFSSVSCGAYAPEDAFRFVSGAPATHFIWSASPTSGVVQGKLRVRNTGAEARSLALRLHLQRDQMPEVLREQTLALAAGAWGEVSLDVEDQSSQRMQLDVRVKDADAANVFYSRHTVWDVTGPYRWVAATPKVLPLDFQFAYFPYSNRMRLRADVTGMPKEARVDRVVAAIRPKGRAPVKSVVFDKLVEGRQELAFDLPPLKGEYEIAMTAEGQDVPEGERVQEFERTVFPWERNDLGKSRRVYPPFTPLKVQGRKVMTVGREHEMNGLGLWQQVTARGKPLLARPMSVRVRAGGKEQAVTFSPLKLRRTDDQEAVAQGAFRAGPLNVQVAVHWDYDGAMRADWTLEPCAQQVDELTLTIPVSAAIGTHLHAMGDGIRNTLYQPVPPGHGLVWTAKEVATNDLPANFCSYIYLGSPVRGLCWFAENDRGWSWDRKTPNLQLERDGDAVVLRIHLINRPLVIERPRRLSFGLQAAPVKPRISPWRYRWRRDNYTLLGTDINWLARGNCGSVYPAGKDMVFWEAIRRGNRERLGKDFIEQIIQRGLPLFQPYGPKYVERWERHVRHNLTSRFGKKMVFYYNRASCQLFPEFQTFQSEWALTDFRTVGKGKGVGEIKIVPSESYIDHALYWYGKSFDIGGNQGVYWDNFYLRGTYNTAMSDAYVDDNGETIPATGIWELRELARRTFQYMNERGMIPITMPHMTSTAILPMLSFATVQYDWEWKYSQGDVQNRFPRDYILLVTNGELAGTWPVLLNDHGKLANDPWTQRTFAGVCLVHELDGNGMASVWEPLRKPIDALLDDPRLEVYRYWDERPQPVVSNSRDLPTIIYSVPGREAIALVTSFADADTECRLTIDTETLKLGPECRVTDAETGDAVPVKDHTVTFPLKKHDVRELRLTPAGV